MAFPGLGLGLQLGDPTTRLSRILPPGIIQNIFQRRGQGLGEIGGFNPRGTEPSPFQNVGLPDSPMPSVSPNVGFDRPGFMGGPGGGIPGFRRGGGPRDMIGAAPRFSPREMVGAPSRFSPREMMDRGPRGMRSAQRRFGQLSFRSSPDLAPGQRGGMGQRDFIRQGRRELGIGRGDIVGSRGRRFGSLRPSVQRRVLSRRGFGRGLEGFMPRNRQRREEPAELQGNFAGG